MSMQTDKAQLLLLKEIAQQLCQNVPNESSTPRKKKSSAGKFSIGSIFKVIYASTPLISVEQESTFQYYVFLTVMLVLILPELSVCHSLASMISVFSCDSFTSFSYLF